ncbi:hypothetical protein E8L90_29725 [Brevibacillus antibioticus]|uniref:DNA-directed DNA polymerase n=1 Tax=Brevibacillus antibioticus TaxID=2570228 RepID=A0A4U2XYE9_9BACL|nr:DNA polymerase [Brevibacillus antibioticus]TKI52937.1 hypothetical protein E8L90_29725 [Brevibacillus antibioticus]
MKRKPHILTKGKTSKTPDRIVFFDSESHVAIDITEEEIQKVLDGERVFKKHELYLICANFYISRNGKEKHEYHDYHGKAFVERFWQDVDDFTRWRGRTFMFAHNAKYDTLVTSCVPMLVQLGYEVLGFSDSNPFILRLRKSRGTGKIDPETGEEKMEHKSIVILSSTNYYQQSLESLGRAFQLAKLEHDHTGETPIEDSITYCKRDVEILTASMLAFMKFIRDEEHGSFAVTVAGQAFNSFRTKFMEQTIYIHDNRNAIKVERDAYAGGRNECWHIGEVPETVYGLDVNSMYPSVMIDGIFPVELLTFRRKMTLEGLCKNIEEGFLVCCEARVKTDYPIFHLKEERLIFPVGEFWTSLSTPELVEGLQRGLIQEVKNVCVYRGEKIFTEYVDYFYNRRLEAKRAKDSIHDLLYKIFLNSLYGKFGQKDVKWERFDDTEADEIWSEYMIFPSGMTLVKAFGGGMFRKAQDADNEEAWNSFCAIASHVTAMARMMLFGYAEKAGLHNVYYMDTDSLFVNKLGYNKLKVAGVIDDMALGALALEKVGTLTIHGCKDYVFVEDETGKQHTKIKGVPSKAKMVGESKEGKPMYITTQWMGYSKALKNGNMTYYENELIVKELKREYEKGATDVAGRVTPHRYIVV